MSDLLKIENLSVKYETADGTVYAANGVNLTLREGETLGLVGETGAGKTTVAKSIMRLIPSPPGVIDQGKILFRGKDLLQLNQREMRHIRGNEISMIFQDPMTSLNPVMTVGDQIAEVIRVHNDLNKGQATVEAGKMLEMVGIQRNRANEYPHQFSGGMKQRVIIAIALACNPQLLIADEPTTALDVTIQAQVLELMRELRQQYSTAMLLITHDLGVVRQICDKVAVIYAGEIVEFGSLEQIFRRYLHPYTEGLFKSIPRLTENVRRLSPIKGLMVDPQNIPKGCPFSPRCNYARPLCHEHKPPEVVAEDNHYVKCFKLNDFKLTGEAV